MRNLTVTKEEVSQEFDLEEILGVDVSNRADIKARFGQAVIDHIRERVADGTGINGRNLRGPYSEDYSDSLAFNARGKSRGDVNMTLRGNMLGDMDILESDGSIVKIGFKDETETLKAFNHQTGDTVPKRPFFGINGSETDELASLFSEDVEQINTTQVATNETDQTLADVLTNINNTRFVPITQALPEATPAPSGIFTFGDLFNGDN